MVFAQNRRGIMNCTHTCSCEHQTFEQNKKDLPNQIVTNVLIGALGATLIARSAESIQNPGAFIFQVAILSGMEAMLCHVSSGIFRRSANFLEPISSVAIVGGLTYKVMSGIYKVELSADAHTAMIGSVAFYALFRGTWRFATMQHVSIPFSDLIKPSASGITSLFKTVVAAPVKWAANKVNLLWQTQSEEARAKKLA